VLGYPGFRLPAVEEVVELTLRMGRRTNPATRCAGISLNTSRLEKNEAERLLADESERLGFVVADPMLGGAAFDRLVEECLRR
jgi:uncharacterized NAD-dependent epimerase/dehydratase family protein